MLNIWDEVDEIREHHQAFLNYNKLNSLPFPTSCSDRDSLLKILDQFRPRRFEPDNRETWPEIRKPVLAWNELDIHKIVKLEETSDRVKWLEIYNNLDECVYPLDFFKWWQPLPGLEFPGEEGK